MTASNPLYQALIGQYHQDQRLLLTTADGEAISYDRAAQYSAQIAHVLTQANVQPGDRVMVQVAKSPEALYVFLACVAIGAVFIPLNPAYTLAELDYFAQDATPSVVICDPANAAAMKPLAQTHQAPLLTLAADGTGSLATAAALQPVSFTPTPRRLEDLAAILYTSGTTGRSKGAMLSQGNLLANAQTLVKYWQFTEEDVLLHALPIFHMHGLFIACNVVMLAGASMIFLPGFNLDKVLAALPQASSMMGVPTFYTRMLADPRFDAALAAHMRLFISGSAPLLAQTHREFEARIGHRILERYGMSETGMNTSNPYEGERRSGSVGPALPDVTLRITDPETGIIQPSGQIGMIEVKGPNVFKGYWQMPEKTAAEFKPDGFFITGDLGYIDTDGYVTLIGREKDLIISGGLNIYPKEVEKVIDALEGVIETAVIGVPHEDFGEAVVAIIVAQSNMALKGTDILNAIAERLAKFKQPKKIFFVNQLPRNAMGKVQKNILRQEYKTVFTAC